MADDRTTVELSVSVRDRFREMKTNRNQTYDQALDKMLSAFGYPPEMRTAIDPEQYFTDSSSTFRCHVDPPGSLCIPTLPFINDDPYLYKSQESPIDNFFDEFEPLLQYFRLYGNRQHHSGSFVINHGDYSWSGSGLDDFLQACENQDQRHKAIDPVESYLERGVYVYNGNKASLQIYGEISSGPGFLTRGGISLLTRGCPTQLDFRLLLDRLPMQMSNGLSWNPLILNWKPRDLGDGPDYLTNIEPQNGTPVRNDSNKVYGYICENPYFGELDRLLEDFTNDTETASIENCSSEDMLEAVVEQFTATEQILLRSPVHSPAGDTLYDVHRLILAELPSMNGKGWGTTASIRITPH